MAWLDILRRKSPSTATELAQALDAAREAERTASAEVERLVVERARLLLDGDDRQLDACEGELTKAQRSTDRATLAIEELARRLDAARISERATELDKVHVDGEAALQRAVAIIGKDYVKLAVPMAKLMHELAGLSEVVRLANERLHAAGDARRIADPDQTARPRGPHTFTPPGLMFVDLVRLPSVDDPVRLLWPPSRDIHGLADDRPRPAR